MDIAQLVQNSVSITIPKIPVSIFAGQSLIRSGDRYSSLAGFPGAIGIAQSDLPAFITAPQANGILFNSLRTVNVATNGRLAIRVLAIAGQFESLSVGNNFGILNGDVAVIGSAGIQAAVTINGNLLIIDEKVIGPDGTKYILTYFN